MLSDEGQIAFNQEINQVNELLRELIDKISRLENKKNLYKDLVDLTLNEINTIIVISNKGKKSMSEIAATLGVTSGTPTVTIDRLISKGYVLRTRDDDDRRQVFVILSDKGTVVLNMVLELKNRVSMKVFGILSDSERRVMIEALSKVNKKFESLF